MNTLKNTANRLTQYFSKGRLKICVKSSGNALRGEIYWVDLGEPIGSEPGFVRPVIVIQDDMNNASRLGLYCAHFNQ